jgi:Coenzyme PQQ synthesis protein D (PqqD)
MSTPIGAQSQKWKIAPSVRSSSDRDGSVLLDTEKGVFYGANSLGSKIWELIRVSPEGITSESLSDRLTTEIDVSRDQFARDLEDYLQRLAVQGLLVKESVQSSL